ncbi:MAG: hypothetical protein AAFQ12_05005 [Pseudomonadota bacterium]
MALATPSLAVAQNANAHPVIGDKAPRELLNRDLAALPMKQQQAWIHGAVTQAVTVLSGTAPEMSACIAEWYFGAGTGKETLVAGVRRYPDLPTGAMVWAVAQRACPPI